MAADAPFNKLACLAGEIDDAAAGCFLPALPPLVALELLGDVTEVGSGGASGREHDDAG